MFRLNGKFHNYLSPFSDNHQYHAFNQGKKGKMY